MSGNLSRAQQRQLERHQELANLLGVSLQEVRGPQSRAGTKHAKPKDPASYARYDWEAIAQAYDETDRSKAAIAQLARTFGCQLDTIYRALDHTGRTYPPRTSGPARQDECARGHDMAVHGRPIKGGGRYCSECKRRRERKAK